MCIIYISIAHNYYSHIVVISIEKKIKFLSCPRKIIIIKSYSVTMGEMTQTISIYIYGSHVEHIKHAIRSDSCIGDGEEQGARK